MATTIRRAPVEPAPVPADAPAVSPAPAPLARIVVENRDLSVATEDESIDAKEVVTLRELALTLARAGVSTRHIAEKLKLQKRTVGSWLYAARREGLLGATELLERMTHRTNILALEAIDEILENDDTPPEVKLRAAQEHLKGKGFYQHHAAINQKVDGQIITDLRVSFEMTTPDGKPVDVIEGSVIGTPETVAPAKVADDDVDATEAAEGE